MHTHHTYIYTHAQAKIQSQRLITVAYIYTYIHTCMHAYIHTYIRMNTQAKIQIQRLITLKKTNAEIVVDKAMQRWTLSEANVQEVRRELEMIDRQY